MITTELDGRHNGYEHQMPSVGYVTSYETYDGSLGPEIDLGLANSPIGPAPELETPLAGRSPLGELSRYPDPLHIETRQLVVDGIGLEGLDYDAILFSDNGSYGVGDEVIRHLAQKGYRHLYAPEYSFPNVAQWIERHPGIDYIPVPSDTLHPLASQREMLQIPPDELNNTVVYVDYPNNPFGVGNPRLLREVIDYTTAHGAIPVIDVAFGEVLGEEFRDAIQHTVDRGGVALGSLSKSQGLPGLRTGYAILPHALSKNGYSGSQRMVFGLNREAEFVHGILWSKENGQEPLAVRHARRVAAYNREANTKFIEKLTLLGLIVEDTDVRTPIQVVRAERPDLYQRMGRAGIKTESLADYSVTLAGEGHGDSAVRILTPGPNQMDEVTRRIEIALR